MSKIVTVTLRTCDKKGTTYTSRHRQIGLDPLTDALHRAVKKHWGKGASFCVEGEISRSGLTQGRIYGQVGVSARGGGTDLITSRLSASVN